MKRAFVFELAVCLILSFAVLGCQRSVTAQENDAATAPPAAKVVPGFDASNLRVDRPERFPLTTAGEYMAAPELNVTGVVSPDVSRQVPVPSLATGRIVEIDARLGDLVKKGQLLFKVRSTDVAGAYSDYRKAVRDEQLARVQLNRAQVLYDHGAIPKSTLDVAQDAEDDALVDVDTTTEHIHLMGLDPDHPSGIVSVYAPTDGTITDQQITNESGVQALTPPNPFTISDMSHVWIVCDVYENDLAQVHLGEYAEIHLNAYPDRVLKARIANILPILDPSIRTSKVRLELQNPGYLRLGMFATATFHGQTMEKHATVPSTAILHLHDREWVYVPSAPGVFRRQEVVVGNNLSNNMQEINSGLKPGERLVANALVFQNTVEQ